MLQKKIKIFEDLESRLKLWLTKPRIFLENILAKNIFRERKIRLKLIFWNFEQQ